MSDVVFDVKNIPTFHPKSLDGARLTIRYVEEDGFWILVGIDEDQHWYMLQGGDGRTTDLTVSSRAPADAAPSTPEQRAVTLSAAAIRYRTLHKMGQPHNREMLEAWREFVSLLDAEIEGSGRG